MAATMTTSPAETWDEIRAEWLPGGGDPPFAPEVVVAAFKAARQLLGRTWPEDVSQGQRGPIPFRWVVTIGCRLAAVEHLPGVGTVIAKIAREGWASSALAELAVAAAAQAHWPGVELEPSVPEGQSPPDARVPFEGKPIHIEVARPELSDDQTHAYALLARLAKGIYGARAEAVVVEALVTWPPRAEAESELLRAAASEAAAIPGGHIPLAEIGGLWISPQVPSSGATQLFPSGSRIHPPAGDHETAFLSGHFALGDGSSPRRVVTEARIAYDERLRQILARKRNKQLPKNGHNVFVLDVTRVPEGLRIAPPVVERFFHQTQRVGAVMVFDDGDGRVIPLVNPRARAPLPPGFVDTLARGLAELIR